jgi:imidazolonepropionase-like amidohydrolase
MTTKTLDILDGVLLDCTGAKPREHISLRVTGGRISNIWQGSVRPPELQKPADRTVEARGKTIMPGLIDAHVHISYGEGRNAEEVDVYGGPEWNALRAAWNAQKVLKAGVTTIVDPGGTYNVGVAVRDAINNGMFAGPRMCTAGRHITADGGFADYFPVDMGMPSSAEGVLCSTKDEMLKEVRVQAKNRVDFIKLSGDSQAQETNSEVGPCFNDDELSSIIGMSHQLGRKVTVHARYAETIVAMIRHGIDWVLHASHLRRQDFGYVRDSGVPLCPTVTFAQNIVDHGDECGSEPGHVEFRKREIAGLVETFTRAYQMGIPIMAGSETGFSMSPYGEWHAREIELLVSLFGLTPMDAILAMTRNNAKAIGWENDVGTLQVGCYGDILLVDGNPLEDVRILQDRNRISAIFKGGEEIDRAPVPERPRLMHERGFAVSSKRLRRDPQTQNAYASQY